VTWRDYAACYRPGVIDPDLFVSDGKGHVPIEAMRICRTCPVRINCLDEALATPTSDDEGVWGGTTVNNRNEIRMRRMTPARAMALGDRIADLRTEQERLAEDEPWLLEDGTAA